MAMRISDILKCLDEAKLQYELHEVTQEPIILFPTNQFMDNHGRHLIMVVIQLTENGEFVKFFTPSAYHIPMDDTAYGMLKTFSIISWQVKLVDFEVDPADGEVRPTIDFAIEDGTLTSKQLERCCKTLARVIDILHPYIKYAQVHNEVSDQLLTNDISQIFLDHVQDSMEPTQLDEFRDFLEEIRTEMGELTADTDTNELTSDIEQPSNNTEETVDEETADSDDEWI